jgi:hypothetical protein
MRPTSDVRRVFELQAEGCSKSEIARRTGVSRSQVRGWLASGLESAVSSPMRLRLPACGESGSDSRTSGCAHVNGVDEPAYAYLLGQYLGDGMLTADPRGVFRLRISMCDGYPEIMAEGIGAILAVMPGNKVCRIQRTGCTEVVSYSKHWICLFPQHGAGRKHLRPIVLKSWQEGIVLDRHPQELLRGLIHSDGCRVMNWVTTNGKRYTYPRYLFSNKSDDIRAIFTAACQSIGVEWRTPRPNIVSVARRDSVRKMDAFIGPKS